MQIRLVGSLGVNPHLCDRESLPLWGLVVFGVTLSVVSQIGGHVP